MAARPRILATTAPAITPGDVVEDGAATGIAEFEGPEADALVSTFKADAEEDLEAGAEHPRLVGDVAAKPSMGCANACTLVVVTGKSELAVSPLVLYCTNG